MPFICNMVEIINSVQKIILIINIIYNYSVQVFCYC